MWARRDGGGGRAADPRRGGSAAVVVPDWPSAGGGGAPSKSARRAGCGAWVAASDPTLAAAYLVACFVVQVAMYLSILTWDATTLWGAPDPGWDSLLPLISLGLALNPAIQAVFLTGVSLSLVDRCLFWWLFDDTRFRARAMGAGRRADLLGRLFWGARIAATVVQQAALVALGCASMLVYPTAHAVFGAVGIASYLVYETLSILQRAWFVWRRPSALAALMLFLEVGSVPGFCVTFWCFRSRECAGGAGAAPAFEFIFYFFFAYTPAFRVMDVGTGAG